MMPWPHDPAATVGKAAAAVIAIAAVVWGLLQDRHERALVAGGHCTKITEALYSPPPSARSSCYGEGASQTCTTHYYQADPYMRSLWRCADPEGGGRVREFWRRTTEEFGK